MSYYKVSKVKQCEWDSHCKPIATHEIYELKASGERYFVGNFCRVHTDKKLFVLKRDDKS